MWGLRKAGAADLMMIMARTDQPDRRRGPKGISTFIVPTDSKGYAAAKPEDKMGLRASNTAGIALDELPLPPRQMLGGGGVGVVFPVGGLRVAWVGVWAQGG